MSTDSGRATAAIEPWQAATWSGLWPGLGQWILGQKRAALAYGIGYAALCGLILACFLVPWFPLVPTVLLGLLVIPISIVSMMSAYRSARPDRMTPVPASGWKPAFFARMLPGLGHFLDGRILMGIVLLIAFIASTQIPGEWLPALAGGLVSSAAFADALLRGRHQPISLSVARSVLIVGTLLTMVGGFIAPLGRSRVVRAYRIPSQSMVPTLLVGDYLLVDRTRAGRAAPDDLLVYVFARNRTQDFIHRCVATAGQTIELRDKALFVDGVARDEPYVVHSDPNIRPAGADVRDSFGPYRIPDGSVFVLGDNRDNANDSRFQGPVPLADVRGRAFKIYWPPARSRSLLDTTP